MERMTLHWSPKSPYVRKVDIVAHETGLNPWIDRVRTVVAMTEPNAPLMRDNPLSKIPTMVLADGRKLFDSVVICEYLDSLHDGPKLFPATGDARWDALRRHAQANGLLDLLIYWRNERNRPDGERSPVHLAAYAAKVAATLDRWDDEAPRLVDAPFDIGQVGLGCALGYLDFRFEDLNWTLGRPALSAVYQTFRARASAQATEVVDDSATARGTGT